MSSAVLNKDVLSIFYGPGKSPEILGKKNERVTLIIRHDKIWIVENGRKDRYPVDQEDLDIN